MISTATIRILIGGIIPGGARGTDPGSVHATDPGTGMIPGTVPGTATLTSDTIRGTGTAGPTIPGIMIPGTGPGSDMDFIADGTETDGTMPVITFLLVTFITNTITKTGVLILAEISEEPPDQKYVQEDHINVLTQKLIN